MPRYTTIRVEPDPIFLRDGRFYTTAGMTAGMDLALALVQDDLGRDVALATAQLLVVFLKRPGGQSQFSAHLAAQLDGDGPIAELQRWILDHLDTDLTIEALAERVHMSPRNFVRNFEREAGTPAIDWHDCTVDEARVWGEQGGDDCCDLLRPSHPAEGMQTAHVLFDFALLPE